MPDVQKCIKLVSRMHDLIHTLDRHRDFVVHQHVSQFYYMQCTVELNTLLEQYAETIEKLDRLTCFLDEKYTSAFHQWRKDIRWLNLALLEH